MADPKPPFAHDDPDAPPSDEERALAEALRDALDDPNPHASADAELARALRTAMSPKALEEARHRAILERTLGAPRRRTIWPWIVGTSGLAAAAAAALMLTTPMRAPAPQLAAQRTLSPLFSTPFPREGATSERMDTVVAARGRDLRQNRFSRWGVR